AEVVKDLISRNGISEGVVRITVSRGHEHPTTVVTACPRDFRTASRPLRVVVSTYRVHPQLARFKTASRLHYVLARREAEQQGADEALLLNPDGRIAEFSTANIFLVCDGVLLTPPVSDGVLPGITRAAVLELAGKLGIATREQSLSVEVLAEAEEVFATNSLIGVARVCTWGRSRKVTALLQRAYRAMVAEAAG
ncbi:MAG: aminotransferase class IV, partial [Verrucomicrobiae bacterium]|nr:aminotransferase class IV [Verrucomicrobiae bacterium]